MYRLQMLPKYQNTSDEQLKILGYGVFGYHERSVKMIYPKEYEEFNKQIQPAEYEPYKQRRVEKIVKTYGTSEKYTIQDIIDKINQL